MALRAADTRAKLIAAAIYARGWSEDMMCRGTALGAVEIIAGKARRRAGGRTDYTLRVRVPESRCRPPHAVRTARRCGSERAGDG